MRIFGGEWGAGKTVYVLLVPAWIFCKGNLFETRADADHKNF